MPISQDDQARLPGLTPYSEVAERQRLADMKAFRQYLVETGTVNHLVDLYKHVAKTEMRLDNPNILLEFMENTVIETAETKEITELTEENSSLATRAQELQAQAEVLEQELAQAQRLAVGRRIWKHLISPAFWEGELSEETLAAGLPMDLLYRRLCGQTEDTATKKILVNYVRPRSQENLEGRTIPGDAFMPWVSTCIPDYLHEWCRDVLLPRLSNVESPTEPPYEAEFLQKIRDCIKSNNLSGEAIEGVRSLVELDGLFINFLDSVAEGF